jgi:hypothetical protein
MLRKGIVTVDRSSESCWLMRSNRRETENSPLSSLREIVREYLRTEKPPLVGEDIRHNIDSCEQGMPVSDQEHNNSDYYEFGVVPRKDKSFVS